MNTTGFVRGYMSKNLEEEKFLHHVVKVVEKQLQEWDESYKVEVAKIEGYTILVQDPKGKSKIDISKSQVAALQSRSPYSLDRFIWTRLKEKGLELKEVDGNYLDYVFR